MPSHPAPAPAAPFTARQGLFAASLTGVAGFVDGLAFIHLGGYFVSFMSGNSTRAGADLAEGFVEGWAKAMGLVAAFVLGVMLSSIVLRRRRRRHGTPEDGPQLAAVVLTLAILVVAALLAVVADLAPAPIATAADFVVPPIMAAAMGAVNGTFTRGGEVTVGLTYMTGTLVKTGQHLVTALSGGSRTLWLQYLALWAAIALGSILGAVAYLQIGLEALWFAVASLSLSLLIARRRRHRA
jgi:uncharacterized membrane protein YoaK (UPF0700 family)